MREQKSLKPQDILVLLWLLLRPQKEESLRHLDIAYSLKISPSEAGLAINRLMKSRLITQEKIPIKAAALEFLIHGLKYVFPVEPGPVTRGVPTAHSARPLSNKLIATNDSESYVWPDPQGKARGQAIMPLYKTVPYAAKNDEKLHEFLALIDAMRVGRAREVNFAVEELKRRIKEA